MIALDDAAIVEHLPFVRGLARRLTAGWPQLVDVGDVVQDGLIGLLDAARQFDPGRGIKFRTFAAPRVRGAMIDPLRRTAWPRTVRRQRRELDTARDALRRELGGEPSLAELAARVGLNETRLRRVLVRHRAIELASPLSCNRARGCTVQEDKRAEEETEEILRPWRPDGPDVLFEKEEMRQHMLAALQRLCPRDRTVLRLYYYAELTMKEIAEVLGVADSRVSQLHLRALKRLRTALLRQESVDPLVTRGG